MIRKLQMNKYIIQYSLFGSNPRYYEALCENISFIETDYSDLFVTSIVSSITSIPVDKNIAMTGEVTLRGQVLPIGGLKEKLLAAHRARISRVIIPEDNKKDLAEIPKNILDDIKIDTVKTVDEVLKIALTKELKPVTWIEVEKLPESKSSEKPVTSSTH